MELYFHVQISGAFEPLIDETDLDKIALSCHFALAETRRRLHTAYAHLGGVQLEGPLKVQKWRLGVFWF